MHKVTSEQNAVLVANYAVLVAKSEVSVAKSEILVAKTHNCDKCGKEYKNGRIMRAHMETCNGMDISRQCPTCGKVYKNKHAKYYHVRKGCTAPIREDVKLTEFTEENTDYITEDFSLKCLKNAAYGVKPMMDEIYFNKDHPENHNARLMSLKNNMAEVYTAEGWKPESLLFVVDRMISNAVGTIIVKLQDSNLNPSEYLSKYHAIQGLDRDNRKKLREHAKSQLYLRKALHYE